MFVKKDLAWSHTLNLSEKLDVCSKVKINFKSYGQIWLIFRETTN